MNADVARGASLVLGIQQIVAGRLEIHAPVARALGSAVVAFQADRKDHWPPQQFGVHGTVRIVTGFAALDLHRGMLVYERPTLVYVALQARFFVTQGLLHHAGTLAHAPRWGVCAVRVVAIRTLHEALVHAMLGGHVELRANGGVARVAELVLLLGQEILGSGRMVNRVATGAGHVIQGVLRAPDVGPREIARLAESGDPGMAGELRELSALLRRVTRASEELRGRLDAFRTRVEPRDRDRSI